jgi:hypothetical protein
MLHLIILSVLLYLLIVSSNMYIMKECLRYVFVVLILALMASCKKQSHGPATKPFVSTLPISSIAETTAVSGGNVSDDGGSAITARGICYSTTANPTLSNTVIPEGSGLGSFASTLTGLTALTTYYVRAYATNGVGTAYGNNELFFKTLAKQPTLTTGSATTITGNFAVVSGQVTENAGITMITHGVCYGLSPNPTIVDTAVLSGSGLDNFTVNLTGLAPQTTYYARAFMSNGSQTWYGDEISFTTLEQLLKLGENYNGGIIFYLDETGLHGLIAAPSDQSTSADWGCMGSIIMGADGIAVGAGPENTIDIVAGCTTVGTAAQICSDLTYGGYSDWSLPSTFELDRMNQNLHLNGLGNFSNNTYWSSTEVDANNAASFNFSTTTKGTANKNSPYAVRAVRGF